MQVSQATTCVQLTCVIMRDLNQISMTSTGGLVIVDSVCIQNTSTIGAVICTTAHVQNRLAADLNHGLTVVIITVSHTFLPVQNHIIRYQNHMISTVLQKIIDTQIHVVLVILLTLKYLMKRIH